MKIRAELSLCEMHKEKVYLNFCFGNNILQFKSFSFANSLSTGRYIQRYRL
jgi:hypothetical protein